LASVPQGSKVRHGAPLRSASRLLRVRPSLGPIRSPISHLPHPPSDSRVRQDLHVTHLMRTHNQRGAQPACARLPLPSRASNASARRQKITHSLPVGLTHANLTPPQHTSSPSDRTGEPSNANCTLRPDDTLHSHPSDWTPETLFLPVPAHFLTQSRLHTAHLAPCH